jgi:hypothetical protein
MTAAVAMTQALDPVPAIPMPDVPPEYRDCAFEFKLGWETGPDGFAKNPILNKHMMADLRKAAWRAGYLAYRKAHGLKAHALPRLHVGAKAK